jgi:histidyl-tRNA synthetase
MSKRKWYYGNEINIYLMPLDDVSVRSISTIMRKTVNYDKHRYTCKFICDKSINVPFKERMKNAESKSRICFIFGEEETKNNCVTIKNLNNGKQVLSTYEDTLNKISVIL